MGSRVFFFVSLFCVLLNLRMGEGKGPLYRTFGNDLHAFKNRSSSSQRGFPVTASGNGGQPGEDLGQQLKLISKLPPQQQRLVLARIGAEMQHEQKSSCNVFGGQSSCETLPSDSNFAQMCPDKPLTVDCAYYNSDLAEVEDDPTADLESEMKERGVEKHCDICVQRERELWCAGAVPPCGSFQQHVELAILPSLAMLVEARETGDPAVLLGAVSGAIPRIMATMSLSMPCRAMCQRVVDTCGCGVEHTFGSLIQGLASSDDENVRKLPPDAGKKLFAQVWDVPICNLYTEDTNPDFSGTCTEPDAIPNTPCAWCGTDKNLSTFVEAQLAGQFAQQVYGWVAGPLGLMDAIDDIRSDEDTQDYAQADSDDEDNGGDAEDIVIILGVIALLGMIMGIVLFVLVKTNRLDLSKLYGRSDQGSYQAVEIQSEGLLSFGEPNSSTL